MTRRTATSRRRSIWWLAVPALAFAALYGWPLVEMGRLAERGIAGRAGLGASTISDLAGDPRTRRVVVFTLVETLGSVAVTVGIGVAVAWVLARYEWRGRRFVSAVVLMPFVLPSVVVAGSVRTLIGGSGLPPTALIIAAHLVFNLGLVVRPVSVALEMVGRPLEDAARVSGRGRGAASLAVLRAVAPTIVASALLVGVLSFTSFGVISVLGEGRVVNLEVEIWYRTTQLLDMAAGSVLAAVQIVVVGAMIVAASRVRAGRGVPRVAAHRCGPTGWRQWAPVVGCTAAVAAISVAPIAALVVASLRRDGRWTLANYRGWAQLGEGTNLDTDLAAVLGRSLVTALGALVVAAVVAGPAVWFVSGEQRGAPTVRRMLSWPLGVSAATLGFGFIAAFSGPALDLRGTTLLVVALQAAVIVPFLVRMAEPVMAALDPRWAEAGAVLGADRGRRALAVGWPALRRPLVGIAAFGFAMALGEFGATSFVARGERPTAPLLIGRLFARPGSASLGHARALSVILATLAVAAFVASDLADRRRSRSEA